MARRMTISYTTHTGPNPPRSSNSEYYLATTQDVMRFYLFDEPPKEGGGTYELIDQLDRTRLLGAGDKATAKEWAKRLKLASWTYVKV